MFESQEALSRQIGELLEAVRLAASARYAAVADAKAVLFESAGPDVPGWMLRRFLDGNLVALFAIPGGLEGEGPTEDVFEDWHEDEFLLAFINGKVALVLACPGAEDARGRIERPLKALADRLLRYNPAWRVDAKGRGLFFGRPRLDLVVVGRAE